jgi:cytochrome c oxidase cbb3-type subunit 3
MSAGWSWYIIILTLGNIVACFWLIRWTTKKRPGESATGDTTGHTWDGDLAEYNNPLPRWWLWLFYITMVFAIIYLILYPGLGAYSGVLGWTEEKQYDQQMEAAKETYGPIFAAFAKKPIPELINDKKAMAAGQQLFLNNCASCHGSDARGARGFPNLADNAWLYGGSPEAIQSSILNGRPQMEKGQVGMPPMGAAIGGEEGAENMANYVRSLSGLPHDEAKAEKAKPQFAVCAGCHGPEGKGNPALGAPNLTDKDWLYGSSVGTIKETIMKGRKGHMPAHKDFLGEDKVHLLAAYVYSLSH